MGKPLRTAFDRIDLSRLYPPFATLLAQLVERCARRGSILVATSAGRTYEQQAVLYAQGRTTPGRRVTNAEPGESLHNFMCAADLVPDADGNLATGLQPDYRDPAYAIMGQEADALGLEWGGHWREIHDTPHVGLAIGQRGLTVLRLHRAYERGGYPEVFRVLDEYGPWQ